MCKLCDTCEYRHRYETEKPCIIYSDQCKYYRKDESMKRIICPFCNKTVIKDDPDAVEIVNGKGMFKTYIYIHRSCYIKRNKGGDEHAGA